MKITRLFDILDNLKENYRKPDILCRKQKGEWRKYSVDEYIEYSHLVAYALLELGFQPGDKVATIMNNRPAWNFCDMGIMLAGMVHVPIYPTLNEQDYTYILNHCDAKCVIIGIESIFRRVEPALPKLVLHPLVFTIDSIEGQRSWDELMELGRANQEKWLPVVEKNKAGAVQPDDVATLIYTSGTTGNPKGVMLSHKNFLTNASTLVTFQTNDFHSNILSFLPLCHVYERVINYHYQMMGSSIYYAQSLNTIAKDLKDIHAMGFCAVPRVLEMMFDKLQAAGKDLKGLKKQIYFWAFRLGTKYDPDRRNWFYLKKLQLADMLVYSKWRDNLGGNPMIIVSGGSSIQERIIRLFSAAKLRVYEGYGMTETSPVIAVNNPSKNLLKPGTVGEPMPCIEFKLAEDGEILTKGDCLMKGYYKDPEYTKQVVDEEGWFHTGDIGTMVEGKYLKITDRKKEIFKLSLGKYIAPQVIENILKESDYIDSAMVIGENEKFAAAIILPDFNTLHFWCVKHNIHFNNKQHEENLYSFCCCFCCSVSERTDLEFLRLAGS
ncbi:MAG: long-chain fatty acid--CoA ligase [Bacteroidales bacterium]|nr:long-chain fatty acid--CoA ligase [Bacteroidales bacterium]